MVAATDAELTMTPPRFMYFRAAFVRANCWSGVSKCRGRYSVRRTIAKMLSRYVRSTLSLEVTEVRVVFGGPGDGHDHRSMSSRFSQMSCLAELLTRMESDPWASTCAESGFSNGRANGAKGRDGHLPQP